MHTQNKDTDVKIGDKKEFEILHLNVARFLQNKLPAKSLGLSLSDINCVNT